MNRYQVWYEDTFKNLKQVEIKSSTRRSALSIFRRDYIGKCVDKNAKVKWVTCLDD